MDTTMDGGGGGVVTGVGSTDLLSDTMMMDDFTPDIDLLDG